MRRSAVIYLRVSTARQVKKDLGSEGLSLPAQREACHRKADSLDADVVTEFVDRGESARSANRQGLTDMLAFLGETGGIDYVIVPKLDRLARNLADNAQIDLAIRQAGARLVSVSENIDETAPGRLVHGIMASIAEFYSRNLAAETLKGSMQKAKAGGTLAKAPIGYLNVREQGDGREVRTVVVDRERAPLVQWAFEAYATGNYSLVRLLDELTAKGLRTRPTAKFPAHPLTRSKVHTMLSNPYYAGVISYRGALYEGRHEPLVSRELFERVQGILRSHATGEKDRVHPHYLRGSIFCARCGSRLCITNAKRKYLYFFCVGRQRGEGCSQPYVTVDRIEASVCRLYSNIQLEPDRTEEIRKGIICELDKAKQGNRKETKRQQARLKRLTGDRIKLLQAHYASAVPQDLLKSEQDRIAAEIAEAERCLAAVELHYQDIEDTLKQSLVLASDCERMYRAAENQLRRQFNQVFFSKIMIDNGEVTDAELAEPFAQLLAHDLESRSLKETANPGDFFVRSSNKKQLVTLMGQLSNSATRRAMRELQDGIGKG